jgi:hypothetical protein
MHRGLSGRVAAVILVPIVMAACGDIAGPRSFTLLLSAPDTITPVHSHPDVDRVRLNCRVPLSLQAGSDDPTIGARWTGGQLRFSSAITGAGTGTFDLTAEEVAGVWGGHAVRAGEVRETYLDLSSPELFRTNIEFRYSVDGGSTGAISHQVSCVPPAAGVEGRYHLTTINGIRLPAPSLAWTVHSATLELSSRDLGYLATGLVEGAGSVQHVDSRRHGYSVLATDTFALPYFLHEAGGTLIRSGTTLWLAQEGLTGAVEYTWRFDLEGTSPALPELPRLAVEPDTLFFSAERGGALPAEQRFQVRSSSEEAIGDLTFGTSAFAPSHVPTWMGITSGVTPAEIWVRITSTDVDPGEYTMTVSVQSNRAANSPVTVVVSYKVSEPD